MATEVMPIPIPSRVLSGKPHRPCRIISCPLNETGIRHNVGVFKHNGRKGDLRGPDGVVILFGSIVSATEAKAAGIRVLGTVARAARLDANPPEFIWAASEKRAMAIEKIRLGQNMEGSIDIAMETEGLLRRFCELHTV